MKRLMTGSVVAAAVVLSVAQAPVAGQTSTPRASVPRTADGKPNLQGIWQAMNTAAWDILDHGASLGVRAGLSVVEGGELPYLPGAMATKEENFKNRQTADPDSQCFLPGVPRIMYMPYAFEIVQTPTDVAILFEYAHATRIIHTDGSRHPEGIDFWVGDSRGHWEGDTLVVDVTNLNDMTWFDHAGNFHSDALHVVERYTPTDPYTIEYEATIEDPKVFSRPWKMSMPLYRHREKNLQLLEYECYSYADIEASEKGK